MNNIDNNKYFLYVRKSSESDEKQIQSIDDQVAVMKNKAKLLGLDIIWTIEESMSAKSPWRPNFNEMITRIYSGEANWIISWKLDRISRNPIDSWNIQYMLQIWKLNRVITNDREYNPIDAWLLMSVENWMSNQFLLDLSKNVKRWVKSKAEKWWFPWAAPIGYENELKSHTIIEDNSRFNNIKRIWKLMISWDYTVNEIRNKANNEWWLRTKKDKELSKSSIYAILNNVFYTWDFMWKWNIMKWKHSSMISYAEYNRVQEILWKSWKAKLVKHDFSYTWFIRCWECWSMITAWHKHKFIKDNNSVKEYSYYRCTKNVKISNKKCNQKSIRIEELEKQINNILWELEIIDEFKDWAIKTIKEDYKKDILNREWDIKRLQSEEKKFRDKIDKLTDMLLSERITNDIFDNKKKEIELSLKELQSNISNIDINRKDKIDKLEKMFNFVSVAKNAFNFWDYKTKKIIFSNLGLQFTLNDWIINVELYPWLKIVKENQYALNRVKWEFASTKNSISSGKTNTILSACPIWQGPHELHVRLSGSESEHSSN